jgi:hypothetical protein
MAEPPAEPSSPEPPSAEARFFAERYERTALGLESYEQMAAHGADSDAQFPPKAIVQFVMLSLMCADVRAAFRFCTIPASNVGLHERATDASVRCDWARCRELNGFCTGGSLSLEGFESRVRADYAPLLCAQRFELVGSPTAWGESGDCPEQKGRKHPLRLGYAVEFAGADGLSALAHFVLVYNRALESCHSVCSVSLVSARPRTAAGSAGLDGGPADGGGDAADGSCMI